MTASTLNSYSQRKLARLAKKHGVPGWHAMCKAELVTALLEVGRRSPTAPRRGGTSRRRSAQTTGTRSKGPASQSLSATPPARAAGNSAPARKNVGKARAVSGQGSASRSSQKARTAGPTKKPRTERLAATPRAAKAEQRGQRTPQVPELKTVFYSFRDPYTPSEDNTQLVDRPEDRPGLVRRELDYETPIETSPLGSADEVPVPVTESDTAESATTSSAGASSVAAPIAGASSATVMPEVLSDSIMYAPEVIGLRFRYFDGRSWRSSWNSLQQKGLPVAVEMAVQLASLKTAAMLKRAATAAEDGSQPLSEEESVHVAELETVAPPPVHRVVVYLPGSPLRQAPQKRPSTARERIQQQTEPRRSAPSISLQPRLIRESPAAASEQWMRSSQ